MFHIPIGFADHYLGDDMLYVTVACGTKNLVEKVLLITQRKRKADLVSALSFSQLEAVLEKSKNVGRHSAMGV